MTEEPESVEAHFSDAQVAYVEAYLAKNPEGHPADLDRLVAEPCGLPNSETAEVFTHPSLGKKGLEMLSDLMAPEGSMYFDAIFGANYGQVGIRNWLIPMMTGDASFLEFRPTRPAEFLEDARGGTSIDEWMMVACIADQEIPLANGISVRRLRNGWIQDVIDVYDTMSTRTPPPAPEGEEAAPPPLPPYPEMNWQPIDAEPARPLSQAARAWLTSRQAAHAAGEAQANATPSGLSNDELYDLHNHPAVRENVNLLPDMMHPTDSLFIDSLFGRFEGQDSIRTWCADIGPKQGRTRVEAVAPAVWDGNTSLQMFREVAIVPGVDDVETTWGFSVRRFQDGWLMYAADYFDAASFAKAEVQAARTAAGVAITLEDVMRYRGPAAGGA